MPTDYAIKNGRTVMDATIYTGSGANTTITNIDAGTVGFQPDLVWAKGRSESASHVLQDSVRGFSGATKLSSNSTNAENNGAGDATDPIYGWVTNVTSSGFSVYAGTTPSQVNKVSQTYVAWQWQAGAGTTSNNTSGTITSTVSVNAAAGFSIATFNAGASGAKTVGHGLGVVPKLVILKSRTSAVDWVTYHATAITNTSSYLVLNTINATVTGVSGIWGAALPTSSVVGFTSGTTCGANDNMVMYSWAEVDGFSKFGGYTGTGNADGPFVYLGFRPKFVLLKCTNNVSRWIIIDSTRSPTNITSLGLWPDASNVEYTVSSDIGIDILSNGFKLRSVGGETNYYTGGAYIYAAFAENPFKYANAR